MNINSMKKQEVLNLVAAKYDIYSGLLIDDLVDSLSDEGIEEANALDSQGFYDLLENFVENNY